MTRLRKAILYLAVYGAVSMICILLVFTQNTEQLILTSEGRLSYLLQSIRNGMLMSTGVSLLAVLGWSLIIRPCLSDTARRGQGLDSKFWRGFQVRFALFIFIPIVAWLTFTNVTLLFSLLAPLAVCLLTWQLFLAPLIAGTKKRGNGLDDIFWREFWSRVGVLLVLVLLALLASVSAFLAVVVIVVVLVGMGMLTLASSEHDQLMKHRSEWRDKQQ